MARLEKWTARLIDEHWVEWDDDAIRTRALYLATEELAQETRKGAPELDPKWEPLLLTAARQRIYFRATQGILGPEDELFPLREGEPLPRLLSKPWTEETRVAAKGRAVSETSSDSEYEKRRPNTQLDTWCRQHEAENPGLKVSEPREEARERRIRLGRVAYYRELEDGERVALSGSVMGPQMEPPVDRGPRARQLNTRRGPEP